MVLAKSALIMSMSLFLLDYTWKHDWVVKQPSVLALSYLAFVAAETAAVFLALRHPSKDYLGIINGTKLLLPDLIGSLLCISSGILLILLESEMRFPVALDANVKPAIVNTVFASMSDTSILCGLLIIVGGVLILLRSRLLGAAISIIFGLFPPILPSLDYIPPPLPPQFTYHLVNLIWSNSPYVQLTAVAVGSLPVIGGLLALYNVWRKIR